MKPRPQFKAPDYRSAGKLKDCVALITGGDSGIGRSVAFLFAREGADIAIIHLHQERVMQKPQSKLFVLPVGVQ
jgi:NAD(P)-dependent dehydrogenase (short-subunit alcohol dehydrogenase family)